MRAAFVVGGIVVAGCLGALGAVEAQKYSLSEIWPMLTGSKTASTTAAAPAEAVPAGPPAPHVVVTDVPAQAPRIQAVPAPATQVAAAPKATPAAPAAPAAAPHAAPAPPVRGASSTTQVSVGSDDAVGCSG